MVEGKKIKHDQLNRELELLIERKKQENLALMKLIKHLERNIKNLKNDSLAADTPNCI
jgi:hypothetical protein